MEDKNGPSRKPVLPHSRSISLQMLTNTPGTVPIRQEMYTERLQPIRPPPGYHNDSTMSVALAPPLAPLGYRSVTGESSPDTEVPAYQSHSKTTPASNVTSRNDRAARAVSLPAPAPSLYDSMFSFSSQIPDDFASTIVLPASAHYQPFTQSGDNYRSNNYSAEATRENYIQNGRIVSSSNYTQRPQSTYETLESRPGSSLAGSYRTPPGGPSSNSRPPSGLRRPSMLNALGNWLDKK